ncbi:MAG: hypothetical protein ACI4XB_03130 [Ruminococcus sp.]
MKKERKYFAGMLVAAVSFCCIFSAAVPASAAYGDEYKIMEETEDFITFQLGGLDYDYCTVSADNNCFYWDERDAEYYAVTLDEGTAVPEDWSTVELELAGYDNIDLSRYLGFQANTFALSEFDENLVVLENVINPQKLYETDGVTGVYQMCGIVTMNTNFGTGRFSVFVKPDITLTLEDFSLVPEVNEVSEVPFEMSSGTQVIYEVSVDNGFSGSSTESSEQTAEFFDTIKRMQQVENVDCAIPECTIPAIYVTTPTTYTLARVADPDAYGDIDNDGTVNADDAYRVLAYYAEQSVGKEDAKLTAPDADKFAEAAAFCAGDVNGDGVVNGDDAYIILCYYAAASVGDAPEWNDVL